ncbi:ribokinase [Paenibacillus sp. GD4]|uniref:ribokinase n=1 Tax=Paenibacillus sp. GD4 TaxID=3068890 RepID=UPI002796832F|nr:ribokinase [Paenibacillus sp. GD4]MDQ1909017.1 ribokinase [Paenibacillus sp. GD4]
MNRIVVVGSINVDIVSRIKQYPVPGETIKSESTEIHYGGKGANQAVAAALSGGDVTIIGAVGSDPYGQDLIRSLQGHGVDTSMVTRKPGTSGMAYIMVEASGQNIIVLAEGANGKLMPDDARLEAGKDTGGILVLQNEIPWATNESVIRRARSCGMSVIFNPAPAVKIPKDELPLIDTLILNESETEYITGRAIGGKNDAELAARQLLDGGVGEIIVTMGALGSLYMNSNGASVYTPARKVKAVDTTSAGDTFIGCYAAELCAGKQVEEALQYASAAAAIAVTRKGAQSSIPTRDEVEHFMKLANGESGDAGETDESNH